MIKMITVREAFEKATGNGQSRGLGGFPLKAFPVGHKIVVDSPLVLLIGDNGSGKSTFLEKLDFQFHGWGMDHWYMDIECDQQGEPDSLWKYESGEDYDPMSDERTPSHGEYALQNIPKFLSGFGKRRKKDIIYFDEPENGISLRNKNRLVRTISDYAFSRKRQIFVATHEPEFLKIKDARVINLDNHPATSCVASDFDLEKYMGSN